MSEEAVSPISVAPEPRRKRPTHEIPVLVPDVPGEWRLIGWMIGHPAEVHTLGELDASLFTRDELRQAFYLLTGPRGDGWRASTIARRVHPEGDSRTNRLAVDLATAVDAERLTPQSEAAILRDSLADGAVRRHMADVAIRAARDAADPHVEIGAAIDQARRSLEDVNVLDDAPLPPLDDVLRFIEAHPVTDRDWVVNYFIARAERFILTARGGLGKSLTLRTIAVMSALGMHPFTHHIVTRRPPKVLLVEAENRSQKVARTLAPLVRNAERFGDWWDPSRLVVHVDADTKHDITTPAGFKWLWRLIDAAAPDLVCIGPMYRLAAITDNSAGGIVAATALAEAIDRLRTHFDCAFVIEAHAAKGDSLEPFGSGVWNWWTDFGYGMRRYDPPSPSGESTSSVRMVEVVEWKKRDEARLIPSLMTASGPWLWEPQEWHPDPELWGYKINGAHLPAHWDRLEPEVYGRPRYDEEDY